MRRPAARPSLARRRRDRVGAVGRAVVLALSALTTGGLVLLHLGLLWSRLEDLSLWRPEVALRWLGALLLVGAGALHHRRGHSLLRGRGALAFWILVLLLHAGSTPATGRPLPLSEHPPEAHRPPLGAAARLRCDRGLSRRRARPGAAPLAPGRLGPAPRPHRRRRGGPRPARPRGPRPPPSRPAALALA
ncbi:MAG: hypothetical protein M5U13_10235 [Thermoanaerobaculia bacterium]|nr:hypothetical protein [Thermoanaerobaculia bacterium]